MKKAKKEEEEEEKETTGNKTIENSKIAINKIICNNIATLIIITFCAVQFVFWIIKSKFKIIKCIIQFYFKFALLHAVVANIEILHRFV